MTSLLFPGETTNLPLCEYCGKCGGLFTLDYCGSVEADGTEPIEGSDDTDYSELTIPEASTVPWIW